MYASVIFDECRRAGCVMVNPDRLLPIVCVRHNVVCRRNSSEGLAFVVEAEKPGAVAARRFDHDDVRRNSLDDLVPVHVSTPAF